MVNVFSGVIAACIIVPALVYIVVYPIARSAFKNNRKAAKLSVDVTTFFLILAVHFAVQAMVGESYIWLILIILALTASVVLIVQYKAKDEVDLVRFMKGFWRMTFLLFGTAYFLLCLAGMAGRVIKLFV